MKPSRILILNYNGADLLRRYLGSFVEAAARASAPCGVTVVDNCSTDSSRAVVEDWKGRVEWMPMAENRVLCSYNDAARAVKEEVLIFMNNDIEAYPDFVDPLVRPFSERSDVFFVTPRCLAADRATYEGNRTRGRVRYGVYWSTALFPGYEAGTAMPGHTMAGGFGAFDRAKFLELGGYDDLYLPGRLEDTDVCFRAQKRGWACLYEPSSLVYHQGGVSFNRRFGARKTLVMNARNTFLFMWKNLDARTLVSSTIWLPLRLAYSLLSGRPELFLGFLDALPLLPKALGKRRANASSRLATEPSDEAIFSRV